MSVDSGGIIAVDRNGIPVDFSQLLNDINNIANGSAIVTSKISRNTDRIFDFYLTNKKNEVTLEANTIINSANIILSAGHGAIIGDWIEIYESNTKVIQAEIINVVANVITINFPVGEIFTKNAIARIVTPEMAINASVINKIFSLQPLFDATFYISRYIVSIIHAAEADDSKFGSIAELTNGMLFRRRAFDENIETFEFIDQYNIKKNGDWGNRNYDLVYSDKAGGGKFSTKTRRTFSGQDKNDSFIILQGGASTETCCTWEVLLRDNLSTLTSLRIIAQGVYV